MAQFSVKIMRLTGSVLGANQQLHDTDEIYAEYRARMIDAQKKHLDFFKKRMSGEA
jgi:hypothetical protein